MAINNNLPEAGQHFLKREQDIRKNKEEESRKREDEEYVRSRKARAKHIVTEVLEDESSCVKEQGRCIICILICLFIPILGWAIILGGCLPCYAYRAGERRARVLKAAKEGEEALNALEFNDDIREMEC